MRVVIAGAGLVGWGLAKRLGQGKHDVVVIDADREVCERLYSQLGVTAVHGSATSIATLEDAALSRAGCAVGTMRGDNDNLCFALLAKHMGVPRTIVRMRDPRYEEAYKLAGVTRVLNVVDLYLNQFVWEIEEPAMQELTTFGEGKASIVFMRVPEGSRAAGRTIEQIAKDAVFPTDCVIVGIFRAEAEQFIIPRGQVTVNAGDRVYLAASSADLRKALRYLKMK
ncbi:MAG: TrkA family potassium uptake protein [Candidatus Brocadiae bacterium]|nr:TrkA family potassium uptake protein [Candidatus Brocadiia bacterium]